ncbi:MAG TPA: response regulator [Candidatus Deferrimicrobiaceae bacterium]|nr:response regulator [Candidatus Deferrimicrobiaceae bacterium]
MLVEDDAVVREVIDRLLVGFGARVTAVAGADEALDALPRARADVLVSDIDMPGEDGYALIRKIRALPADRGGETPAVGLTGWNTAEHEGHMLRAGYQSCLAKPVDAQRLVGVVAALVALTARRSTGAALVCRAWTALEAFRGAAGGARRPREDTT